MTLKAPLTAVYPGTFDPMTLGHEDLMRRASRLFDRLILAVAAGHHKRTMFTIAERVEIASEIAAPYKNVEVMAFRGLLRDFVVDAGLGPSATAQAARLVVPGGYVYLEAPQPLAEPPAGLLPWRSLRAGAVHAQLFQAGD